MSKPSARKLAKQKARAAAVKKQANLVRQANKIEKSTRATYRSVDEYVKYFLNSAHNLLDRYQTIKSWLRNEIRLATKAYNQDASAEHQKSLNFLLDAQKKVDALQPDYVDLFKSVGRIEDAKDYEMKMALIVESSNFLAIVEDEFVRMSQQVQSIKSGEINEFPEDIISPEDTEIEFISEDDEKVDVEDTSDPVVSVEPEVLPVQEEEIPTETESVLEPAIAAAKAQALKYTNFGPEITIMVDCILEGGTYEEACKLVDAERVRRQQRLEVERNLLAATSTFAEVIEEETQQDDDAVAVPTSVLNSIVGLAPFSGTTETPVLAVDETPVNPLTIPAEENIDLSTRINDDASTTVGIDAFDVPAEGTPEILQKDEINPSVDTVTGKLD